MRDPLYDLDLPPPVPPQWRQRRSSPWTLIVLTLIFLGLLGFFLWQMYGPAPQQRLVTPRGELSEEEKSTIQLFQEASPAVVYITTANEARGLFRMAQEVPRGSGSGFIWDEAGHIVTNFHVIQGADFAQVTLSDHTTVDASLVGAAPEFDVAVLKINVGRRKLQALLIGTSHDLVVGQKVFAIGNPFGLDQTLTTGVVSAVGRTIPGVAGNPIGDVIQTDAAINPGNSGGPLLDSAGRLIGVNTAIYSPSGAYAGIGFAVPVDLVKRAVEQIISEGRVTRPLLGITSNDRLSRMILERMGQREGLVILGVEPNSPAEAAQLRETRQSRNGRIIPGDIVLSIDNRPIRSTDDLYTTLQRYDPGDTITLRIRRGDQDLEVPVTLSAQRRLEF